jgi:hypothetical protein
MLEEHKTYDLRSSITFFIHSNLLHNTHVNSTTGVGFLLLPRTSFELDGLVKDRMLTAFSFCRYYIIC